MSKTKFNRDYDFNKFQVLAGILSESNLYEQGEFIPPESSGYQISDDEEILTSSPTYKIQVKTVPEEKYLYDEELILDFFKNNRDFEEGGPYGHIHQVKSVSPFKIHTIIIPEEYELDERAADKLLKDIESRFKSLAVDPNAYLITLEEY